MKTKKEKRILQQQAINGLCAEKYDDFKKEWNLHTEIKGERLNSCNAVVFETENYIGLRSYSTVVAFIDKATNDGYDVLRLVYGYTATSSQHISKFFNQYPKAVTALRETYRAAGINRRWTYYPV